MPNGNTTDISTWDTFEEWGDKAFLLQSPEALSGYGEIGGSGNADETILYWLLSGYGDTAELVSDPNNIEERLREGGNVFDSMDEDRQQEFRNIVEPISQHQLDLLEFGEYSGQIGSYQQGKLPELKELARGVGSGMKGGITGSAKRRETTMGEMGGKGYLEGLTGIYGNIQGQQTMAAADIDNTFAGWTGGITALI